MAFQPLGDSPGRDKVCTELKSLLLKAFPAKNLETHFRAGYTFRSDACTTAFAYDPDYCIIPGDVKMDPEGFGPEREATVGMIQSAFNCSPVGETLETLRQIAIETISNNLWRSVEADLVADLAAFPDIVVAPGTLEATCALADAAQFLAVNGNCGKGIIVGPYDWFIQLGTDHLVWNGTYHTDTVGNIVIPLSVDNNTVYAFDSNVDIRITETNVMDELMPSIRSVNDRIVRAEAIYTVAIDPCVVGSFTVSACCDCGGGGGGGGGVQNPCGCQFAVTNFPANQNVTVTNTPLDVTLDEPIDVNVLNFPPDADPPVSAITVSSHHFDVVDGSPWTPAAIPAGRLTGLSYTVVSDTVTTLDADGTSVAGLPQGFTSEWQVQDDRSTLTPPQSITADSPTARAIVLMSVATP